MTGVQTCALPIFLIRHDSDNLYYSNTELILQFLIPYALVYFSIFYILSQFLYLFKYIIILKIYRGMPCRCSRGKWQAKRTGLTSDDDVMALVKEKLRNKDENA